MSRLKRDLILSAIDATREKRDKAISDLMKHETKLRELRKQLERFDKRMAKMPVPVLEAAPSEATTIERRKYLETPGPDELDIPDYLKRDQVAREQIERDNAERKRTKSQVRVQKMLAKQRGDTAKMPLTGKAALKFIREGK